jgi:hypothetical protein
MKREWTVGLGLLLALVSSSLGQISISGGAGGGTQFKAGNVAQPAKPPPKLAAALPVSGQILFIGNSQTACNDLPTLVAAMFASRQQAVGFAQHTPDNTTLEEHAANPQTAELIASRRWTHVVLQDQGADKTVEAGKKLCEMARQIGATPIYYLPWANPDKQPPGMDMATQRTLNKAYATAAIESKALLAAAGPAWQAALEKNPNLPLYVPNENRPSPEGSYLAACVLFTVIAQRTPVGLPGTLTGVVEGRQQAIVNIPAERARFYQQVAWDTVVAFSATRLLAGETKQHAVR